METIKISIDGAGLAFTISAPAHLIPEIIGIVWRDGMVPLSKADRRQELLGALEDAAPTIGETLPFEKGRYRRGIRSGIKELGYSEELTGLISYRDLVTVSDRILWLLEFAARVGLTDLTPGEIEYMSSGRGLIVAKRGFVASNSRNIWRRYVSRGYDGYRIEQKGELYLRSLC